MSEGMLEGDWDWDWDWGLAGAGAGAGAGVGSTVAGCFSGFVAVRGLVSWVGDGSVFREADWRVEAISRCWSDILGCVCGLVFVVLLVVMDWIGGGR